MNNPCPEALLQRLKKSDLAFVDFMHLALYSPDCGYYCGGLQKFGVHGDFITAPELTPLFGQTLANQVQQIFSTLNRPALLEFGAGSGRLAVDMLQQLESLNCLPEFYYILEVSPDLQQRQQALIKEQIPHLSERVIWLTQWPRQPFNGVIIANEILDAMPVHRFLQTAEGIHESHISLNSSDQPIEIYRPCSDSRLLSYLQQALPESLVPYQSEANLFVDGWIKECAALLQQGAMILVDYGFPRHEYYHPDRNQGTLMCHYQHRAHSNPLLHIGQQDITAHVDFTHVAEAADAAGFHVAGYTSQAAFLLANGLLNLLETIPDQKALINARQAVKKLIQPDEMGELFKVMALTKGLDLDLNGFQLQDKRAKL